MIYLHIGLFKTGSSHLQHCLAANPERLSELGYEFPTIGRRRSVNHHQFAIPLSRGETPPEWDALRAHMKTATDRIIMSGEAFGGVPPGVMREALAGFDVRIVYYVRPATSRLPSVYSQNTKVGINFVDFDTFIDACDVTRLVQWRVGGFARSWAEAFGAENVRVRSLDRDSLVDGDLLTDFIVGIGGPRDHGLTPPTSGVGNESPPWQTVEMLRYLHGHTLGPFAHHADRIGDPVLQPYLSHVLARAAEVSAGLGWTDRGRYLTAEQGAWLTELHAAECDLLDGLGVDARVGRDAPYSPRHFLPTVDAVPADERAAFWESVAPAAIQRVLTRA